MMMVVQQKYRLLTKAQNEQKKIREKHSFAVKDLCFILFYIQ